jgi:Na+/H+ antiporter NhaD/arsenite permease-like protein
LGSIANLIVAEEAKPHGVAVTFVEYLKVGLPLTVITTGLAIIYFGWVV